MMGLRLPMRYGERRGRGGFSFLPFLFLSFPCMMYCAATLLLLSFDDIMIEKKSCHVREEEGCARVGFPVIVCVAFMYGGHLL